MLTIMLLIPVLDLLGKQVVRGVAGKRETYRPIETPLAPGADPLVLAEAFRERFGLSLLYVADLDAILSRQPNWNVYRQLVDAGFRLLVDPGLRTAADAESIFACGVAKVIAGLESLNGPDQLDQMVAAHGADRVIFSLDLKNGVPLCDQSAWGKRSPLEIAARSIDTGISAMLVLDLKQVGSGKGISTLALCRRIHEQNSRVELYTGGGVRHRDDLMALQADGLTGVLISSALHQGTITADDCRYFGGGASR